MGLSKTGLSIRAYARHRGVTDTAVHKAIRTGRIDVLADGTIDPESADQQWSANTDTPRIGTQSSAVTVGAGEEATDGSTAGNPGQRGASLLQARTVNEVVKAQTAKVRLALLKSELVDRAQAVSLVFKLARVERDAWINWPSRVAGEMAAQLNTDPHELHIALESAVRKHLSELGDIHLKLD